MSDYGSQPPGGYYEAPTGGPGGAPVDHPKGTTILVLGILSLVCCSPLGIVAFVMGNSALKEIDASPGRYSNRQTVAIGRILGIIGMVLLVLGILWFVFVGGLAVMSGGSGS